MAAMVRAEIERYFARIEAAEQRARLLDTEFIPRAQQTFDSALAAFPSGTVDALSLLVKDNQFRDNPPNPDYDPEVNAPDEALLPRYTRHQPFVHDITAEMRTVVDEFDDRVLLGELYLPHEEVIEFYGTPTRPELHLPLNMSLAWQRWDAEVLAATADLGITSLWYLNMNPRPSDVTDKRGSGAPHDPSWDGSTAAQWRAP